MHQPAAALLFSSFLLQGPADVQLRSSDLSSLMLTYHLRLARKPKAYVHVQTEAVAVYLKGMEVQRLPVRRLDCSSGGPPRMSYVEVRASAVPTRQVVVKVNHVSEDPSQTVSSLEEIVSVDDMPETFSVKLADGTVILVTSGAYHGVWNGLRKRIFKFRLACRFAWARLKLQPVKAIRLLMDPQPARHFYWLLQDGMGIIY